MDGGRIRRLAESDAHHVGSARNAATIESIVEQLVLNALDAGATSVSVALDLAQFWLSVRDDGGGIEPCDLPRVGQLACTSKATREDAHEDLARARPHGYRGEALFSIGLVSTLEIVSRTAREPAPHMTVLRNGNRVMTCIAPGARGCGTTATVRDIFFNRPVQRKVLARSGAIASTCERVRQSLARLALAHASVKISLRDAARGQLLLETHPSADVITVLKQLYRALPPRAAFRDVSACSSAPPMRLSAHVCGLAAGTPELQLVYVNRRPLSRRDPLTKLAALVIGCAALGPADAASPARATRAEVEVRFPLFLVFVELPRAHVALVDDGSGGVVAQLAHAAQTHAQLVDMLAQAVRAPHAGAQPRSAERATPPLRPRQPPRPLGRDAPWAGDDADIDRVGKRRVEEWRAAVPPALSKRHRPAPERSADAASRALACLRPRAASADCAQPAWAAWAQRLQPRLDAPPAPQPQRWPARDESERPLHDELPPRASWYGRPPPPAPPERPAPVACARRGFAWDAAAGSEGAGAGFERFAHSLISPLPRSPLLGREATARAHGLEPQQPARARRLARARQPSGFLEARPDQRLARAAGAADECQLGLLARSDESGTDESEAEADAAPRSRAAPPRACRSDDALGGADGGGDGGGGERAPRALRAALDCLEPATRDAPAREAAFVRRLDFAQRPSTAPIATAVAAFAAHAARAAAKPQSAAARKASHAEAVHERLAKLTQRPSAATGGSACPEWLERLEVEEEAAQAQERWRLESRQQHKQQLQQQLQQQLLQPAAPQPQGEPERQQPPQQPTALQPCAQLRLASARDLTARSPPLPATRVSTPASGDGAPAGASPPRSAPPATAVAPAALPDLELGAHGASLALVVRRPDARAPQQASAPQERAEGSAAAFLQGAGAQAEPQPLHLTRRLAATARGAASAALAQRAQRQPAGPTPAAGSGGVFAPLACCDATASGGGARAPRPSRTPPPPPPLLQIASAPPDARATATALVVRAPAAMPAAASAHADGAQQSSGASVLSEGSMVLSKQMLHGARVIGQVDRKWIAVALGPALALIDQHAADERVQLEALLSKHVGADGLPVHAESVTLEPAEPLALTAHEASLAREHARALELWGWHVRGLGGADAQVLLVRAPSVCSHVLRARALTEYLATLDELGGTAAPPRAVLRAIVSKACRSAIMFGKALSHEECVAVVAQLARVKFPFQCAHGRPTIVPVLEMSAF